MKHSHPHGNHTHTHEHVAGDLEHTHGWQHAPDRDVAETVYGEVRDTPIEPTGRPPWHWHNLDSPDKDPLVVVPYVPGMLRGETTNSLGGRRWLAADVSGSEVDYWALVRDLWADAEDFAILEHDLVLPAGAMAGYAECPRPWCGYSYHLWSWDASVADYQPSGRPPSLALGCVRFRAELMAEVPDLIATLPDRAWFHLDYAISDALRVAGYEVCRHHPDAEHLPRRRTGADVAADAMAAGAIQKPAELAGLAELVRVNRPEVIVEIGADAGGTLAGWRQLAPRRYAVTLQDGPYSTGRPLDAHGATVIAGDSHDPATRQALIDALAGRKIDFLFIDGDHTYEGVESDYLEYMPLVRPGGLVAFHDICHHPDHPDVGVDRLWAKLAGAPTRRWEFIEPPDTWGGIGVVEVTG